MARRMNKHRRPVRPVSVGPAGISDTVGKRDGVWIVRSVPGAAAAKTYRCPGCQQPIRPGLPHVVAWPESPGLLASSPVEERRHWHTACWRRRP